MDYINTHVIGDIGEAYAIAKFTEHNIKILIPFSMNLPYDYVIDVDGQLYKVQVKTTEKIKDDNKMVFHICRTNPNTKRRIVYTKDEIDYFFLYCIENKWCGIISINEAQKEYLYIYLDFPRYCNQADLKIAADYEFDHKIKEVITGYVLPKTKRPKPQKKEKEIVCEIPGRTTREKLKNEIRNNPMLKVAKIYGVSDNAVRKWCERMGLPSLSTEIKRYSDEEWNLI